MEVMQLLKRPMLNGISNRFMGCAMEYAYVL